MKRAILASIVGIATSVSTAFGDGHILFNNYSSPVYNPVIYAWYPLPAGQNVDDPNVEVQLYYAYGIYTSASAFLAVAVPGVTTYINTALNPTGEYGTAASKGSPGGYYNGPDQVLPGWSPGDTVTFMVVGWETTGIYGGATFATSMSKGMTDLWTETGAASVNGNGIQSYPLIPPAFFAAGPPVLELAIVPEPATLAFAGLGMLSLLALARRPCCGRAEW